MKYFICIIIIYELLWTNNAARILGVFPMPAISHQAPFRPITQELARRGHEVTVITPLPAFPNGRAPKNLKEIDVHEITYQKWKEELAKHPPGNVDNMLVDLHNLMHLVLIIVEAQVKTPVVQALINNKNETFDLVLTEHALRPPLVFSHLYKVPVIQISSFGAMIGGHEFMGSPIHPFLYPSILRKRIFNLTIWEKVTTLYDHYSYDNVMHVYEKDEDAMLRRLFGDDTPSVRDLQNNIAMLFLNVHPIWEDCRPVPPNVIYMGGVHQNPAKELPQDLKNYLDSSEHGVIYFSLGTTVSPSGLTPELIRIFKDVFAKLPYNILWKYDKDELPGRPNNVRIEKWLPQADLLRHPKIKLFITQAGLQSTDEAITAGVPMVALPMLGDQWYNAERYAQYRIGVNLYYITLSEDIFKDAIETVIGDKSFRQNIEKLRDIINDQPQRPLDRAVWWTEHVLRHRGAAHLRAPAMKMSWIEYYEIHLVLVLLTCLLIVVYAVFSLCRCIGMHCKKLDIKNKNCKF